MKIQKYINKKNNRKVGKMHKKTTERYYICPSCGDLTTETGLLDACESGGMPYCYCKFESGDRIFIGYKIISKSLWDELKLKTNKARIKYSQIYNKKEKIKC